MFMLPRSDRVFVETLTEASLVVYFQFCEDAVYCVNIRFPLCLPSSSFAAVNYPARACASRSYVIGAGVYLYKKGGPPSSLDPEYEKITLKKKE